MVAVPIAAEVAVASPGAAEVIALRAVEAGTFP